MTLVKAMYQCGPRKLPAFRVSGCGGSGGGGDCGGGFPSFLPKEVHKIKDPYARTLAQRIQRLPVQVGFSESCIMSSCVAPIVRRDANPVVLLHCFDSSCLEWRGVYPLLENNSLETWAIDILGWGFSDLEKRPPCNVASKRYHLYQLWKSHIKRPMTLVGPSLGAAVAIDFAVNFPEAVDSLVLINPNVYMDRTGFTNLPKSMAYVMASLLKSMPMRWLAKVLVFDGISASRVLDWTNVGRLHCLLPWWEDATVNFMLSGGYNVTGQIKKVKQKVLIICCEQDKIVDLKFSERLKNELPNATLRRLPDCGHMPQVEKPYVIAKLIADFAQASSRALCSLTNNEMVVDGVGVGAEEASRQVEVRFVTKLKPPYEAPSNSIAIPSNLTRYGLSALVNNLLQAGNEDWKSEPFDFLIDGELVRMSLEEFLLAKGISAEKVLEIEYIKAVAPRKEEEPSPHDDWVSAVDGSSDRYILTGCYDGFGRIWRGPGICTHVLDGHSGPVTSVCIVKPKADRVTDQVVATSSKDRTIRLWKFDTKLVNQPKQITAFKILRGHTAAVQSIAAEPLGDMVCSGSWDCTINLWETHASVNEGDTVSVKKRKKGGENKEPQSEVEALSTLVGHTQCVSSVVWPERETLYSASWDQSIRRWDVETGKDSLSIFCGKAVNCLDIGGESSALIAAGGSDPVLRIWDPRKSGTLSPIFQFSSHNSWISSCKWHKKSWFHLISASYDGKVMLWDLRTAWPLAVIDSHKDKVLCADWWKDDSVISGGVDSKLCISSGIRVQ